MKWLYSCTICTAAKQLKKKGNQMNKLAPLAITTCRVSSEKQRLSNSLERQARSVRDAAKELGAIIPSDGQWSGSYSSLAGNNVKRKDLQQMLQYVKRNPRVKYLIVHKVDRFMRSIKELFYFEVEFEQHGVKIWYASEPELNTDDLNSKKQKAEKVFNAEASNVERQVASIEGLNGALEEGRYPFQPPSGYRKGYRAAIHEIDEYRGPYLQENLLVLYATKDPTRSLKALNASPFTEGRAKLKMDKYRLIATNIFYAGYVHMNKKVKSEPVKGLHVAMISYEQHKEIVRIFEAKKKNQNGPSRTGNPQYPLSNLVTCEECKDKPNGRFVGFTHSNGSLNGPTYEKYRCRSCKRYITRTELHAEVTRHIHSLKMQSLSSELLEAELLFLWKQEESISKAEILNLKTHIKRLEEDVSLKAEAIIDPSNAPIKDTLLKKVVEIEARIKEMKDEMQQIESALDGNKEKFIKFAVSYVNDATKILLGTDFDKITRVECKQLLFPLGFYLKANNKVYTPDISPIYSLKPSKKDTEVSEKATMVRVKRL